MLRKSSWDSCRKSSVVAGQREQTDIAYLQDHELDCLLGYFPFLGQDLP